MEEEVEEEEEEEGKGLTEGVFTFLRYLVQVGHTRVVLEGSFDTLWLT